MFDVRSGHFFFLNTFAFETFDFESLLKQLFLPNLVISQVYQPNSLVHSSILRAPLTENRTMV